MAYNTPMPLGGSPAHDRRVMPHGDMSRPFQCLGTGKHSVANKPSGLSRLLGAGETVRPDGVGRGPWTWDRGVDRGPGTAGQDGADGRPALVTA
jgi:hypothetical protein